MLNETSPLYTGRWPVKSAKFLNSLLKNAESNAIGNELDAETLVIRNIQVQQAPVRKPLSPCCCIVSPSADLSRRLCSL